MLHELDAEGPSFQGGGGATVIKHNVPRAAERLSWSFGNALVGPYSRI